MQENKANQIAQINAQIGGNEASLRILEQEGEFKIYKKGEKKYADELGFFRVISGRIRLFTIAENGKEITVFYMSASECCILSTSFMTQNLKDEVMFEFMQETQIFTLKDSIYQSLCISNAKIMQFNLMLMSKRFHQSLDILGDVAFKSLRTRVMKFLSTNAKDNVVQTSQEAIANNIGSAREAVAKVLKELKNEGFINTKRKEIVICKKWED